MSGATGLPFGLTSAGQYVISGFRTPETGRPCAAPTLVEMYPGAGEGQMRHHEDRVIKYESDPGVFPVVLTARRGRGLLVYTGVPLTDLLMAQGDRLRTFSEFTEVTERVSSVDKAEVADTLRHMVRRAVTGSGLPYVGLVHYPNGAASVFILRVDVDGAYGLRTQNLLDAAASSRIAASFFINADLCQQFPGLPSSWPEHVEVGQHAYSHTLFDDVQKNLTNLSRAQNWVERETGRRISSFVAPRGMWNEHLASALASIGYRYSGDFGLDFDSLPFRAHAGILQVPVHPSSSERAQRWADEHGVPAPTTEQTRDYFLAVMQRQLTLGRPMLLYGHPEVFGQQAASVVPEMALFARAHSAPSMTLGAFADFWASRERVRVRATVERDGNRLVIDAEPTLPVQVHTDNPLEVLWGKDRLLLPAGQHRLVRETDGLHTLGRDADPAPATNNHTLNNTRSTNV